MPRLGSTGAPPAAAMQSLFVWPNRLVVPMNGENPAVRAVLRKLQPRIKGLLVISVPRAALLRTQCASPPPNHPPPSGTTTAMLASIICKVPPTLTIAGFWVDVTPVVLGCDRRPPKTRLSHPRRSCAAENSSLGNIHAAVIYMV